jgi:hypothetical protein
MRHPGARYTAVYSRHHFSSNDIKITVEADIVLLTSVMNGTEVSIENIYTFTHKCLLYFIRYAI